MTPTYFHVVDEDSGETICTYTDRAAADTRAAETEKTTNHLCAVTTTGTPDNRCLYVDGHYRYPGELIYCHDINEAA